jgi:hypothetical protein
VVLQVGLDLDRLHEQLPAAADLESSLLNQFGRLHIITDTILGIAL